VRTAASIIISSNGGSCSSSKKEQSQHHVAVLKRDDTEAGTVSASRYALGPARQLYGLDHSIVSAYARHCTLFVCRFNCGGCKCRV
jgi:hypothetical protein